MGTLEDRLRQREAENEQIAKERQKSADYEKAVRERDEFVRSVNLTLTTLEENDWPAGVSPHANGDFHDSRVHPTVLWGSCLINSEEVAFWPIHWDGSESYDHGSLEYRHSYGYYILLRNGRYGYIKCESYGFRMQGVILLPVKLKVVDTGYSTYGFTKALNVGTESLYVHHLMDGLAKLREDARKWATP